MRAVIESITLPIGDACGVVVYRIEGGEKPILAKQRFRHATHHYGADGNPVWGWNGVQPVTLSPSFDCVGDGWRFHCFLIAGKIQLCPDSTVR